jgi:predicted kinase
MLGMSVLYVLIGLQGSGKTTWASANAQRLSATVLASDSVRNELVQQGQGAQAQNGDFVFGIFNRRLLELLRSGQNVISDATHARRAWRRDEIMIGRSRGVWVVGVWFDVPLALCLARNASRAGSSWGDQVVPEAYLREVAAQFEAPAVGEFDEIWRLSG